MSLLRLITFRKQAKIDPDAQAFITAAGITNPTQQSAINTLVTSLKGYGLWTKMIAIYPFVGGTADTCKFNLKNPQNTDAAFRLTFAGTWVFSSLGADPVSGNQSASTYINPSTHLQQNNVHASVYINENDTSFGGMEIGTGDPGRQFYFSAYYLGSGGQNAIYNLFNSGFQGAAFSNTNTNGFYTMSRISSTSSTVYKNTTKYSRNVNSTAPANTTISLATDGVDRSTRRMAFASFGEGLTDGEASNLYTAVQAFQTTLGRQV